MERLWCGEQYLEIRLRFEECSWIVERMENSIMMPGAMGVSVMHYHPMSLLSLKSQWKLIQINLWRIYWKALGKAPVKSIQRPPMVPAPANAIWVSSLPIHFYSDHHLFILFRIMVVYSTTPTVTPCTATDHQWAHWHLPYCSIVTSSPFIVIPWHLFSNFCALIPPSFYH